MAGKHSIDSRGGHYSHFDARFYRPSAPPMPTRPDRDPSPESPFNRRRRRYRILTNGKRFRVQRRGWFFWHDLKWFLDRSNAEDYIRMSMEDDLPWRVDTGRGYPPLAYPLPDPPPPPDPPPASEDSGRKIRDIGRDPS